MAELLISAEPKLSIKVEPPRSRARRQNSRKGWDCPEVYLLHFSNAIGNPENSHGMAQHYIGVTHTSVSKRVLLHKEGDGASITRAVVQQYDYAIHLARVWQGGLLLERKLKSRKNAKLFCPICQGASAWNRANYDPWGEPIRFKHLRKSKEVYTVNPVPHRSLFPVDREEIIERLQDLHLTLL